MKEYHKIQAIYKRQKEKPRPFIEGEWSLPEFEYLAKNKWQWTEKVDGTNIRIGYTHPSIDREVRGRTDNAQLYAPLVKRLEEILPIEKLHIAFSELEGESTEITLFGEGYGKGIQKGGKYRDEVDFVLFDVSVGNWILRRPDVENIAEKLGIRVVPILFECSIFEAVERVKAGIVSTWGDFPAEGVVGRTPHELRLRNTQRIITKIKHKDFPR